VDDDAFEGIVCSVLSAVQEPFDINLIMCISVSLLYVAAKTDIEEYLKSD
jgi:hypothetical protein